MSAKYTLLAMLRIAESLNIIKKFTLQIIGYIKHT